MSYLRPILRDEMFKQEGDGWDFLATHVFANQEMFRKILQKRIQQETIMEQAKERNNMITK